MKILFVTTLGHLPQSAGGSKSSTHELCSLLKFRGHDVAVLCSLEPKGLIGIRNRLKRKIFPKVQCPADHVLGYPVFRGRNPIANISEDVRQFKPDISITQAGKSSGISESPAFQAMLEKRLQGFIGKPSTPKV